MADDKAFSHITVSADDEDDVVIEAGARLAARPAAAVACAEAPAPDAEKPSAVSAEKRSATEPARPLPQEAVEEADDEEAYGTRKLEDLTDKSMPTAQKVVLAAALLLLVAAVAYYYFFMR